MVRNETETGSRQSERIGSRWGERGDEGKMMMAGRRKGLMMCEDRERFDRVWAGEMSSGSAGGREREREV